MEIVPLTDPYAIHQDGKDNLTGDWVISTHSITLTAGTLTAEQLTSTDDITAAGTVTAEQITSTDDITAGDNFFASQGLVGSPSYSFTASPTTGIYLNPSGADNLLFVTDGAYRLDLDALRAKFNVPLNMNNNSITNVLNLTSTGTLTSVMANLSGSLDINKAGVAGYHGIGLTTDVTTTLTTGYARNYVSYFNVNPAANSNVAYVAIEGQVITPTTNTRNLTNAMYGLFFSSNFRGQGTCANSVGALVLGYGGGNTGILTNAKGVWARAGAIGVGKVTNAYVYFAQPYCNSSGAGYNTNSYGFYLDNSLMTVNATNAYGLYLEDVNYGDTLNYAIYSAGGLCKLLGTLEVGSTIQTYTPTNVTTNRSFNADTVVVAELADIVGTLIADLQIIGLVD